jgi:hypothetical protein
MTAACEAEGARGGGGEWVALVSGAGVCCGVGGIKLTSRYHDDDL